MSLHRVDPRFVLPHRVSHAVVLDGLREWAAGLASAGIDVSGRSRERPDLVVAPARLAGAARATRARSIILEGSRERALSDGTYGARRLLLRPSRDRPTLALPLDQPTAVSYALEHWSVVDRRWKRARVRTARELLSHGLFPSWASPVVTVATQEPGAPGLLAAAQDLGIPTDANWFLTFGQGDALSRNAFHVLPAVHNRPEWVLKFARVPGYSERFDNDERGLQLARDAGGAVAAHAPRLLGRFNVDGVHASLETFAVGGRLRDVLITPGDRTDKLKLIERIGSWILELGRCTQTSPETMGPERERLRNEVVSRWTDFGVGPELVDDLPPLPAVAQHNDLGTWNVVVHDHDFVVVDWENVRPAASPLWDLLYFLGNAFVLLDGPYTPAQLPPRLARLFAGEAWASPRLFAWVRRAAEAAAVPSEAVGAIATLCWLSHSLSAGAHNVDIATFAPRDPPRLHGFEGMARAWMAHPALGPGWRVWRNS
jgi:Phosphotransferase enzyme family